MASGDLVQAYTREGFPMRPLVMGQTTRVEVLLEVEGSTSVTVTNASFKLARNSVIQPYTLGAGTVISSGNELYVDITGTVISTTLGANELECLNGIWEITVSGQANPVYFEEVFFVSRKSIACPLRTRDLVERFPQLGNPNSYPIDRSTGARQTSWAPQIRIAWRSTWEWFATLGREKAPWLICNAISLQPLVLWETMIVISQLNVNGIPGDRTWEMHLASALDNLKTTKATTLAYYQRGTRNNLGEQPSVNRGPIQEPIPMTGVVSDEDFGKF